MAEVTKLYTKYSLYEDTSKDMGIGITAKVGPDWITICSLSPCKKFQFQKSKKSIARAVIGLMVKAVEIEFEEKHGA